MTTRCFPGLFDSSSSNATGNWGVFYSVMCGEDAAFITQRHCRPRSRGFRLKPNLHSSRSSMSVLSVCQFWGVKPVPAIQKEPVRSSIPTLILQGEYDPLTAPSYGIMTAQTLKRSYFFLLPGVGHLIHSPTSTCPDTIQRLFGTTLQRNPKQAASTAWLNRSFGDRAFWSGALSTGDSNQRSLHTKSNIVGPKPNWRLGCKWATAGKQPYLSRITDHPVEWQSDLV